MDYVEGHFDDVIQRGSHLFEISFDLLKAHSGQVVARDGARILPLVLLIFGMLPIACYY